MQDRGREIASTDHVGVMTVKGLRVLPMPHKSARKDLTFGDCGAGGQLAA